MTDNIDIEVSTRGLNQVYHLSVLGLSSGIPISAWPQIRNTIDKMVQDCSQRAEHRILEND